MESLNDFENEDVPQKTKGKNNKLVCVVCSIVPTILYEVEGFLCCNGCATAELRKIRFKEEESEFNNVSF